MDNKYYTPTIEEFLVGFEYEQDYDHVMHVSERYEKVDGELIAKSTWSPKVFKVEDWEFLDHLVRTEFVRVKYLDQEDIESLGWKYIRTDLEVISVFTLQGKIGDLIESKFTLRMNTHTNAIDIKYMEENSGIPVDSTVSYTLFTGHLKNKSELKTLMKWLRIE